MLQRVSDIKDNIFNVTLFFTGLFSLRQGAKINVVMKNIKNKIMYKLIFSNGANLVNNNTIMKYNRLHAKQP